MANVTCMLQRTQASTCPRFPPHEPSALPLGQGIESTPPCLRDKKKYNRFTQEKGTVVDAAAATVEAAVAATARSGELSKSVASGELSMAIVHQ